MKILLSALESSANLHAIEVITELRKHESVDLVGIYELEKENTPLYKSSEFSAMGFVGVLHLVKKAKKAISQMVELAKDVDAVLLIDSPAFNIPLAKALKKAKIKAKITYYILPQVWAWKEYRAKIVRQNCDNLASILPFESKFYENCHFVGHPLLEEIQVEKNPAKTSKIVFMPGSRRSEIKGLMGIFKDLAKHIKEEKIIVVPPHIKGRESEYYGVCDDFSFAYDAPEALAEADFAFICSGTATLQAALIGTPFVLCYKAKAIDVFIARLFVRHLKHIGLANIILDFLDKPALHAEFIQKDLCVNNLLKAFNECEFSAFAQRAKELREYLKAPKNASENVAKLLLENSI